MRTTLASNSCLVAAGVAFLAGCAAVPADGSAAPVAISRQLNAGCTAASEAEARLVGTWDLQGRDNALIRNADGTTRPFYGDDPGGRISFDRNGNFSLIVIEGGMARFASESREEGSDAENRMVVHGSITNYGSYWVQDCPGGRELVLRIRRSTFPNWNGVVQRRRLVGVDDSRLRYVVPNSSSGGQAEFVWDRIG